MAHFTAYKFIALLQETMVIYVSSIYVRIHVQYGISHHTKWHVMRLKSAPARNLTLLRSFKFSLYCFLVVLLVSFICKYVLKMEFWQTWKKIHRLTRRHVGLHPKWRVSTTIFRMPGLSAVGLNSEGNLTFAKGTFLSRKEVFFYERNIFFLMFSDTWSKFYIQIKGLSFICVNNCIFSNSKYKWDGKKRKSVTINFRERKIFFLRKELYFWAGLFFYERNIFFLIFSDTWSKFYIKM